MMKLKDVLEKVEVKKRDGKIIEIRILWSIKDEEGREIYSRDVVYGRIEEETASEFRKRVRFEEEAMLRHILYGLQVMDETEEWRK